MPMTHEYTYYRGFGSQYVGRSSWKMSCWNGFAGVPKYSFLQNFDAREKLWKIGRLIVAYFRLCFHTFCVIQVQ